MSRALASICVFLGLCGTGAGCAPHTRAPVPPVNQHPIAEPKVEWPAPTWVARFTGPTHLRECVSVEQSRVCVGELGERWLDGPKGAVASPYLAPETLVAALPTASGRYIFVGQRGTRYSAENALGPFTAMQPALQRFEAFQVIAGRWYGINARGELWRGAFEDRVGNRVPEIENLLDFAIAPSGKGLALSIPETLWWTDDAGERWRALDAAPMGATRVSLDADGGLRLLALLPGKRPLAQDFRISAAGSTMNADVKLRAEPALTPDIRALEEGRAVWTRDEWLELRAERGGWELARGRFDAPLRVAQTRGLDDCQALKLAAHAPTVFAVCQTRATATSDSLQLRSADSSTLEFTPLLNLKGNLSQVQLAALDANRMLALGLCLPSATPSAHRDGKRGQWMHPKRAAVCGDPMPSLISRKPRASGAHAVLDAVVAPGANLLAPHVAVSEDGTAAAFVARSQPNAAWKVYLSTDGGRTFLPHDTDGLPATGAGRQSGAISRATDVRDSRSVQSLNFGEDRSLALVLRNGDAPVVYNFDDRGQLIASSSTPPEVSRVAAIGTRILAVSLTQRNVYQSLDRGASFELVGHLPAPACRNYAACPVICRAAGCLVGERFTRVSWGLPGSESLDINGNPEQPRFEDLPVTERVSFRTPITCEVQSNAIRVANATRAPVADQVSVGELLWYLVWQDPTLASAGIHSLRRGQDTIATARAFAPGDFRAAARAGALPADAGLAMDLDDAGLVFMRSKNVPRVGEPLGDLELAWLWFERPAWAHARFRDAEPIDDHDFYLRAEGNARLLLPSLLSATREGVFVAPHAESDTTQFVTPASATLLERIPWPVERVRDVHWTKFKGTWYVYALDEIGAILLRASKPLQASPDSPPWSFAARTVSNPRFGSLNLDQRVRLGWGHVGPTLLLGRSNREARLSALSVRRVSPDATVIDAGFDVALPESSNDPPVACSARDRREMTRVVLPLLPKAARAVQVLQPDQPARWLVATEAVLYASSRRTCVDVLLAEALPGSTAVHAVIGLRDAEHATVFRSQSGQLQASHARCRFDAHAKPPPEYETRLQARWNLEHLPLGD